MVSHRVRIGLLALPVFICSTAWAQTASPGQTAASDSAQSPTPAPAPTAAPAPTWTTVGRVNFSAMVDGYYSFNDNHPASDFNELYNFNDKTNQVDLNLLKLTASANPAPVGFRVDIGLGRAFDTIHSVKPDPEFFRYVEQAYISFKPRGWKGFEADFGDFVTSAGAEVIETKDNWNYSRSLLFAWAIPYYHFGVRTSMPVGSNFNFGVQVVNGWNNIVAPSGVNMTTVGLSGAITRKKFTWTHNYYVGPENTTVANVNRNRSLYDTVLVLTPNDTVNAYLNFDYGEQHRLTSGHDHWMGFAGALHVQVNKHFAITPRAEYFNDPTGFSTGTAQKLHEVTLTGEYKILSGLLSRAEFRRDGSNVPFFDRGTVAAATKSQTTVTVGFIAFFPLPKS